MGVRRLVTNYEPARRERFPPAAGVGSIETYDNVIWPLGENRFESVANRHPVLWRKYEDVGDWGGSGVGWM